MGFKEAFKKVPWGILGTIVGLIIGIAGLWVGLVEKEPQLKYEIANEANVLDVRTPLKDLIVTFQGENIQEKSLNLRIFNIVVSNLGQANIVQGDYDQNDVWGLLLKDGKIIEARMVDSNSPYLKSNINPHIINDDIVQFNKVIFEKGQYFRMEMLVLHTKDKMPEVLSLGKIAGVKEIVVEEKFKDKAEPSFFTQIFYGGAIIQILRLIVFFFVSIGILIGLVVLSELVDNLARKLARYKRTQKIKKLLYGRKPANVVADEPYRIYIDEGPKALKRIEEIISNEKRLLSLVSRYMLRKESESTLIKGGGERQAYTPNRFLTGREKLFTRLVENKSILIGSGSDHKFDPDFLESFNKLKEFVKSEIIALET